MGVAPLTADRVWSDCSPLSWRCRGGRPVATWRGCPRIL